MSKFQIIFLQKMSCVTGMEFKVKVPDTFSAISCPKTF